MPGRWGAWLSSPLLRRVVFFRLLALPGAGTAAPRYRRVRASLRACLLLRWLGNGCGTPARRARYPCPTFLPAAVWTGRKTPPEAAPFKTGSIIQDPSPSPVTSNASVLHLLPSLRPPAVFGHRPLPSPKPSRIYLQRKEKPQSRTGCNPSEKSSRSHRRVGAGWAYATRVGRNGTARAGVLLAPEGKHLEAIGAPTVSRNNTERLLSVTLSPCLFRFTASCSPPAHTLPPLWHQREPRATPATAPGLPTKQPLVPSLLRVAPV